jgi:hypothetical protein
MIVIMEQWVEWRLAGEPKYSEKTCPGAVLSITNSTWLDLVSNPDRRIVKPATNCLSYGAACPVMMEFGIISDKKME